MGFRRIWHWGPIGALSIIKLILWAMGHHLQMFWHPQSSIAAAVNATLFLVSVGGTIYMFLQCVFEGPGFVPLGWIPKNESDKQYLQYCTVCKGYKPPRAHHCRKCCRCVTKMDHHCPWINCCVGNKNHAYFIGFLLFAVIGCFHASVILPWSIYHGLSRRWSAVHVRLSLWTLAASLLAVGKALGVVVALGVLLYYQYQGIRRNCTSIEDWIIEKAVNRRKEQNLPPFVYPYDLGPKENVRMFLKQESDGINWPVRPGCGVYDLTCEQLALKAQKRARARLVRVVSPYSGARLPVWGYPGAAVRAPCGETCLGLVVGDQVRLTRRRSHWMFGEKVVPGSESGERGPRGWFPRDAVVPAEEYDVK